MMPLRERVRAQLRLRLFRFKMAKQNTGVAKRLPKKITVEFRETGKVIDQLDVPLER